MKNKLFFILALVLNLGACAMHPTLKTEIDKDTGATIVETQEFLLGGRPQYNTAYAGTLNDNSTLSLQIRRIEKAGTPNIYEFKLAANKQSPRLKIKNDNSLIVFFDQEELKLSPSSKSENSNEPMAEYFPAFRTETAIYSNVDDAQFSKIAQAKEIKIRVVGESRQTEVKLTDEVQAALKALMPVAVVSTQPAP